MGFVDRVTSPNQLNDEPGQNKELTLEDVLLFLSSKELLQELQHMPSQTRKSFKINITSTNSTKCNLIERVVPA